MKGAVTFDYGQTLGEIDTDMLARRCAERGFSADAAALEAAVPKAWIAYDEAIRGGHGGHPWQIFMRALLTEGGVAGAGLDAFVAFLFEQQPAHNLWRRPIPGMFELVRDLAKRGLPMAILSNSEGRAKELLEELGIAAPFRAIVDSGRFGVHKPDPRIFEHTAALLDTRPPDIVHVGDSWPADVLGALAVGMRAIWFRGRTPATMPLDPERVVRAETPEDVVEALRGFGVL